MNRVLGELATAAHRLPQLCSQLARWLEQENTAGRLAHDTGTLPRALHDATASLGVLAASDAAQLAGALDRAQQATAGPPRPGPGGEDPVTRRDRLIGWLCARLGAHVRGRCGCPVCDTTERDARAAIGMPARHPERITPGAARRAGGIARRPGRRPVARR